MLVNDYTRRGFLDGRTARYPTIIVRPGKPNRAVTGIFSSVIRESLNGQPVTLNVDPDLEHACAGYSTAVAFTLALHELPTNALPINDRTLQLPGMRVTLNDLLQELRALAEAEGLKLPQVKVAVDPELTELCRGMPKGARSDRVRELGLPKDWTLEQIVWTYYFDFVKCSGQVCCSVGLLRCRLG
jgi:hypothetical protein